MQWIIYAYGKFMSSSEFEVRYKDIMLSMSKGAALNKKETKREAELKKTQKRGGYLETKLRKLAAQRGFVKIFATLLRYLFFFLDTSFP
eukprot:CAMPEP_0197567344 /NCGR_PEP_ID=MMETSP1320-20131121/35458_1 /TAXON_ID=91990 /ORGANISM="Bolidomonas sp., Strain RCC2347" /LENGTH=88 /DNA_ID=CAMNT_0043129519 /DNA_START=74 /DNA_END=337 /DNA_ORIENTATION=-